MDKISKIEKFLPKMLSLQKQLEDISI